MGFWIQSTVIWTLMFLVAVGSMHVEMTIVHEEAHKVMCESFDGEAEIVYTWENLDRPAFTRCLAHWNDAMKVANSNIEAVGYHAGALMHTILIAVYIFGLLLINIIDYFTRGGK